MTCYLCGSKRTQRWYRVRERLVGDREFFDIYRCQDCGFAQTHPLPSPETLGKYYPSHYEAYQSVTVPPFLREAQTFRQRIALKLKKEVLRLHYGYFGGRRGAGDGLRAIALDPLRAFFQVPPPWQEGQKLLDIGCGDGRYLAYAKSLGWDVYGIEWDAETAARVQKTFGSFQDPSKRCSFRMRPLMRSRCSTSSNTSTILARC
jgi:hypothetical protein